MVGASLVLGLVAVTGGCRRGPAPASTGLGASITAFLANEYRERPVWGTQVGFHAVDSRLDDYSSSSVAARAQWLREEQRVFEAYDPAQLSPDDRVDRDVVLGRIASELFDLEARRTWKTNPFLYTQLAGDAIHALLARDYAPLSVRLVAARDRLRLLPRLLQQARANVEHPSRVHTEAALRQTDAVIRVVQHDLMQAASGARVSSDLARELRGAAGPALAALEAYQQYLADDLLPRSDGDFRLGRERFDLALRADLQTDMTSADIRARAEAEEKLVRRAMYDVALPLWRAASPGAQPPTPDSDSGIQATVAPILLQIAADHPKPEALLETCRAAVDSLTRFVERTGIVKLDAASDLLVDWTPDFARGMTVAGLEPPGPLEGSLRSAYWVQAVPSDWTPQQTVSFLREYNRPMLQVLSMHEAVPGHYVQHCHARRCPRMVRNVCSSGVFEEGWAVYAEALAVDAGYEKDDPRVRLEQLKFRLRSILNARLDIGVHCDGLQEAEAMAMLKHEGFQEESEARGKWLRAQLTATQLCTYFVGLEEIRDLEAADRTRVGAAWSKRDFVERLLAHGSPPVRDLRLLLLSADASRGGTPTTAAP